MNQQQQHWKEGMAIYLFIIILKKDDLLFDDFTSAGAAVENCEKAILSITL